MLRIGISNLKFEIPVRSTGMEPLIPKLRGYFAEFLSESYLVRLGIFYPPTSVGLRYGHSCSSLRGFSRQRGII